MGVLLLFLVAIVECQFFSAMSQESKACGDTCAACDVPQVSMPKRIENIINNEFNAMDENALEMLEDIRTRRGFSQFAHARQTFQEHLTGTWKTLYAWGQPKDVLRLGLFHTGYSGDLFQFYVFDAHSPTSRDELRNLVGDEAEQLIFLFGTVHRGSLLELHQAMNSSTLRVPDVLEGGKVYNVRHRIEGAISITSKEVAKLLLATVADYLDQMVTVNGWRDHHQIESPLALYPGDGKPAVALYWLTQICKAVREELDVIPTAFDNCQSVISFDDEEEARNAYWRVVLHEDTLSIPEQIALLETAISLNPFVGEPEILLAQLHFRTGDYCGASTHSAHALKKFYSLASNWDKRLTFHMWIAFSRLLLMRARANGALPIRNPDIKVASGLLPLVALDDIIDALDK